MNWQLGIRPDQVIVRQDPEFADVGNPRGLIWGEVFYIVATAKNGERMLHTANDFRTLDEAERYLITMDSDSPDISPDWQYLDPAYGSEAYLQEEPYIVDRERADTLLNDSLNHLL